jgi:hypothetical protein
LKSKSVHEQSEVEFGVGDESFSRQIERRLTTLFPSTALKDHAEEVGVVGRDSKTFSTQNGSITLGATQLTS